MFENLVLPTDLLTRLSDLNQFGIHVNNRPFVCVNCGNSISRQYSSSAHLDGTCSSQCSSALDAKKPYSPSTVWVVKELQQREAYSHYNAVVKIDGKLYFAKFSMGSTYQLYELETGKEIYHGYLHMNQFLMGAWYDAQTNAVQPAYVVQIRLYELSEMLCREAHDHVNWAEMMAVYEIPRSDSFGYRSGWIRLYLKPVERITKDFEVMAVQILKDEEEAFLPGYEVTRLRNGVVNFRWSQAGKFFIEAAQNTGIDWLVREIATNMERYATYSSRYTDFPKDAWINLIVGYYEYSKPKHGVVHGLEHINIFPM